MVTMDGFKLIFYPQARRLRLYHVARDPDEMIDLAASAEYRPVIRRLWQRLLVLQSETGDPLELEAPHDWLQAP
jgi:choline-sulfatase